MRTLRSVVAAAVWTVLGASAIYVGHSTASADTECPNLYVVAIPGTWETGADKHTTGPGMLAGVTDGLPGSTQVAYVDYAATAFPWEGNIYGDSKKGAIDNARGMIGAMAQRCNATHIAIVGYSQGADAAGDLAMEIGRGDSVVPPSRIAGVGLISDPQRSPTDIAVGPPVGGAGAEGPRAGGFGQVSGNVRTVCAVGDLYCSTEDDDFVTRFAGFVARTSGAASTNLWQYQFQAAMLLADIREHGGLPAIQAQFGEDASKQRAEQLARFYGTGTHTSYGTYQVGEGKTALNWMHDWIAGMA
ncbi:cutinase family protein [Nocardia sp. NPDC059240]|uniref:cutinase family protein n=1 Tax=Nocardia sp. NPDC059240 TaxID=3346786 RepID=UPI0036BB97F7